MTITARTGPCRKLVERPCRGLVERAALFFLIGLLASANIVHAHPTATNDARVVSPEVGADRKVTVRLLAPHAAQVSVTGDFTAGRAVNMTKDAAGVWSYTTEALAPNIYGYYFSLEGAQQGIRLPDPGNLFISSGAEHLKSYVEVPPEKGKPEIWSIRDVPHGDVHSKLYKSPSIGTTRRLFVYTPPGYDPAKTYPTVYLLHASGDNETYWFVVGRANFVMDNLIADGKCKPAIVVSCFCHKSVPPEPEEGADGEIYSVSAIQKNIVDEIIPLVEKEYHASSLQKDRAIYGFSMGGYQSLTIGLNNPKTFGYVAGYSFRNARDMDNNFKGLNADLEQAKSAFKLVRLGAGTGSSDRGNIPASTALSQYLTSKGIKHEAVNPEGGMHAWGSWRGYWADFMTSAFGGN